MMNVTSAATRSLFAHPVLHALLGRYGSSVIQLLPGCSTEPAHGPIVRQPPGKQRTMELPWRHRSSHVAASGT
eukprot:CAMPEP_0183452466 /NCGR_PEP_ID=MMETSP0370-20130417/118045_1 /TAXON_ID=268820 /ORGANISM="Peridinium aciculiferum, Strain PAER-2" /LENGTH=72 /DNA_ID=CAMNT_0025643773 /DNA_START=19 /DNA_END=233 /DNA_ORIENTATION=-